MAHAQKGRTGLWQSKTRWDGGWIGVRPMAVRGYYIGGCFSRPGRTDLAAMT